MPRPVFPLRGRDLAALGLPAGPRMGELLAAVRSWWWQGGCVADAAACQAELARITGAADPA
jgi:poly(A) polymerase/tRNA nucleotidyltransferase (CCA-adding enzyme)